MARRFSERNPVIIDNLITPPERGLITGAEGYRWQRLSVPYGENVFRNQSAENVDLHNNDSTRISKNCLGTRAALPGVVYCILITDEQIVNCQTGGPDEAADYPICRFACHS